eukprot:COSAG05_NODE_11949_length_489_cov_1.176923_1_plen_76_part_00
MHGPAKPRVLGVALGMQHTLLIRVMTEVRHHKREYTRCEHGCHRSKRIGDGIVHVILSVLLLKGFLQLKLYLVGY